MMCKEEAKDVPNVITGTFSIQVQPVDISFDWGTMHSFIYVKLVEALGLVPTRSPLQLSVILPNGRR